MAIATGKFRFQFPEDIRESIISLVIHPAIPFFIATDSISWMVMGLIPPSKNKSDIEESDSLSDKHIYEMIFDVNKVYYTTENINVRRYFDYHPLLFNSLNVNLQHGMVTPKSIWTSEELKRNEIVVLQSLINDPDISDFKRSQVLEISHPTISRIRKSLISKGILKTIIKPNLRTLGLTTFSWFNIKLHGKSYQNGQMEQLCYYPNNIFSMYDNENMFILLVFEDMNDIMKGQQKINEFMTESMISYDDISFNYFSLENPSFSLNLNPLPATCSLMGISDEDTDILTSTPEQRLMKTLCKFISMEEASSIVADVKKSTGTETSYSNPMDTLMSMILELLTEPQYFISVRKRERTALQVKLIEQLNKLHDRIEKLGEFGAINKSNKLMIVEDSKAMTDLLRDLAKEANFNVVGASDNGHSAYDLYRNLCENNKRPDAVLMDIFIKGLNGVEATRMIKDYDPTACIIVLTSSPDNEIRNQMKSLGVDDYLIKPVTNTQLIKSLGQSLVKRKGLIK
jgi:two-component system chemotaxis response regulator CheY